jgi:CelD/BcsL family acetyltransferase involved in cellulose biosynthesis
MARRWELRSASDCFDDISESWDRIAARSPLSAFVDSSWFLSARDAFPEQFQSVEVHILRHFDAVLAVLPLQRSRSPVSTLSSVTNAHFPFWAFPIDLDQPLIDEEILRHAMLSADCLSLDSFHFDGPSCRRLRDAAEKMHLHAYVEADNDDSFIRLISPWPEMQKTISYKMIKGGRSKRRHLEELGQVSFESIQGGPLLDKRLSQCFVLETLGWKGSAGVPILSDPQALRFYTALAHRAAKSGVLRINCLLLDDRLIAFQFCLQSASRIDALKISYDPQFAKHSPGDLLLLWALEQASTQALATGYHFGRPSAWKIRWITGINPLCRIRIYSNSIPATLAYHLGPNLKTSVRNSPRLLRTIRSIRSSIHL